MIVELRLVPAGHAGKQVHFDFRGAAGLQHAVDLGEGRLDVGQMFEAGARIHEIECAAGEPAASGVHSDQGRFRLADGDTRRSPERPVKRPVKPRVPGKAARRRRQGRSRQGF